MSILHYTILSILVTTNYLSLLIGLIFRDLCYNTNLLQLESALVEGASCSVVLPSSSAVEVRRSFLILPGGGGWCFLHANQIFVGEIM